MNRSVATFLVMFCSVLGVGCEPKVAYDLRFVDATTGQPVEGARFEAWLWGHHFNNRLFPAEGKESAPPSDADGRTSVRLTSGHGLSHYFSIKRTGYHAITGDTSPSTGIWYVAYRVGDTLPSPGVAGTDMVGASQGGSVVFKMRKLQQPPRPGGAGG